MFIVRKKTYHSCQILRRYFTCRLPESSCIFIGCVSVSDNTGFSNIFSALSLRIDESGSLSNKKNTMISSGWRKSMLLSMLHVGYPHRLGWPRPGVTRSVLISASSGEFECRKSSCQKWCNAHMTGPSVDILVAACEQ